MNKDQHIEAIDLNLVTIGDALFGVKFMMGRNCSAHILWIVYDVFIRV